MGTPPVRGIAAAIGLVLALAACAEAPAGPGSAPETSPAPRSEPRNLRLDPAAPLKPPGSAEQVLAAALRDLPGLLDAVPADDAAAYGFSGPPRADAITPGPALPVLTTTAGGALAPLPVWRVPLLEGDRWAALLTVAYHRGRWRGVDLGAAGLARELQKRTADAPRCSPGAKLALLRLYRQRSDLLLCAPANAELAGDETVALPLTSAVVGLDLPRAALPLPRLLQRLAQRGHHEP